MDITTAFRTVARTTVVVAVAGMALAQAGTAFADADAAVAAADRTAQTLHLTGSVTGTFTPDAVSCDRLAGASWSWTATGSVHGTPVEITFDTNAFRGAAAYRTTGVTDEAGGLATLTSGDVQVTTNGDTAGTFTVARHERSGSIDTTLENSPYGQQVHVSGSWRCS